MTHTTRQTDREGSMVNLPDRPHEHWDKGDHLSFALDGSDYITAEADARKARRGLWQLPFAAERGRPRR